MELKALEDAMQKPLLKARLNRNKLASYKRQEPCHLSTEIVRDRSAEHFNGANKHPTTMNWR